MTIYDLISARRSIRAYRPDPVPEDVLARILEAGRLAPSARNRQAWRFHVVRDPGLRASLVAACREQRFVGEAPLVLVMTTTDNAEMSCGQPAGTIDCSIALSYMMLAAQAEGIGSCWLGAFSAEAVSELLGLEEGELPVAISPLGYPDQAPAARPRRALDEILREH